jgi:hypothetical protein
MGTVRCCPLGRTVPCGLCPWCWCGGLHHQSTQTLAVSARWTPSSSSDSSSCLSRPKSRIPVTFCSQIRGHKGWDITNPKEKMVRRMLQLLQQRAGSGLVLTLLKMPAWEPQPRMFKKGQSSSQGENQGSPSDFYGQAKRCSTRKVKMCHAWMAHPIGG